MRRVAAVLVSVLGLAFTANGYKPLTKHRYVSGFLAETYASRHAAAMAEVAR